MRWAARRLGHVRAKHSGYQSLLVINSLSAGMLRPYGYICQNGMLRLYLRLGAVKSIKKWYKKRHLLKTR
jgi:hypothetical protein